MRPTVVSFVMFIGLSAVHQFGKLWAIQSWDNLWKQRYVCLRKGGWSFCAPQR